VATPYFTSFLGAVGDKKGDDLEDIVKDDRQNTDAPFHLSNKIETCLIQGKTT
jgi:hypothetical protein